MLLRKLFSRNDLRDLIGMTTSEERVFLRAYIKNNYSFEGKIVDLGAWIGSTTIPLAMGLLSNRSFKKNSNVKIFAYDSFVFNDWMKDAFRGTAYDRDFKSGESFLDVFKECTKKYENVIEIFEEDLTATQWKQGKIEFLLVDAMKSFALAENIVQQFYPQLIPNLSVVFHQDFGHFWESWIHLIHYRLKDFFTAIYDVPESGGLAFKCVKKIPDNIIHQRFHIDDYSEKEIDDAFAYSMSIAPSPFKQLNVAAAHIMSYIHKKNKTKSIQMRESYEKNGFNFNSCLDGINFLRYYSSISANPKQEWENYKYCDPEGNVHLIKIRVLNGLVFGSVRTIIGGYENNLGELNVSFEGKLDMASSGTNETTMEISFKGNEHLLDCDEHQKATWILAHNKQLKVPVFLPIGVVGYKEIENFVLNPDA